MKPCAEELYGEIRYLQMNPVLGPVNVFSQEQSGDLVEELFAQRRISL